ncbi:MAG: hypothetical protein JW891_14110 [Candidatus Lokiarchaeota archaeon]|nr:hypothetical protein [Candidatus Lokiarchaeota archaeon]
MTEFPKYDDVGSFPLSESIDLEAFSKYYWIAYKALVKKSDIFENRGIYNYFISPFLQSFQYKLKAGVEIINFPQHMDMYNQFLQPIVDYEKEPGLVESDKAFIPEMFVLEKFAKENYEKEGKKIEVKICITGPIELYLKKHGFTVYQDMALNYAKSVNLFLKNSIINTKYMKTSIVSIDEPSFGYVDLANINNDEIASIFDKSLENISATSQIHLHTLNLAQVPLQTKNIDVLTCEYASDKKNKIPKRELDQYDKFMRVGITRTNINSIMAEKMDSGVSYDELKTIEGVKSLIDSKEVIKKNLSDALSHYRDRLRYVGPDCGLSGWKPPEVAFELLSTTFKAIQEVRQEIKS